MFNRARTVFRVTIMFTLLARWARSLLSRTASPASPASLLMESADVRAGLDADEARALRAAASAWLRVVR